MRKKVRNGNCEGLTEELVTWSVKKRRKKKPALSPTCSTQPPVIFAK